MKKITVYSLPNCVQCNATKRKLTALKLEHEVIDVSLPENEEHLKRMKDLGYLQAPVVFAGDEHWGGYRPDKLEPLAA